MDSSLQIGDPQFKLHRVVTPHFTLDSRRSLLLQREKLAWKNSGVMWCSKLVNLSFYSFCAASRTPGHPRDLGTNGVSSAFQRKGCEGCPLKFSSDQSIAQFIFRLKCGSILANTS
jgi:hypothetical protein